MKKQADSRALIHENTELYHSDCSLTALVEIFGESDAIAARVAFAAGSGVFPGDVVEPFAFVVCGGFMSLLNQRKSVAVTLRPGSALPLCCRERFAEESGDDR